MNEEIVKRVRNNPDFQKLVKERSSFAWKLSIVMLIVYYAFIMTIAFSPESLGASIGSVTTIGIPIGIAIIIISFALTGIYTKRANSEFDDLTKKIVDDARRSE